jgi:cytoskeletal protein CcmA (bactofilin family)
MIFKNNASNRPAEMSPAASGDDVGVRDEVETVVGPSVNVEGDFGSEGNIIVKGTVAGSVRTSKHLSVEAGAKILANVRAGTAKVAGEVRGNMKVKDSLELTSTARVLGDIEANVLIMEAGALIAGRVTMPGLEASEGKTPRAARSATIKRLSSEEVPAVTL